MSHAVSPRKWASLGDVRCRIPAFRSYSSQVIKDGRRFRMAVIGSGPAGFYTAYRVMSSIQDAKVDMYEYLPVPFGLVRFGVAPDHPEVKVYRFFLSLSNPLSFYSV